MAYRTNIKIAAIVSILVIVGTLFFAVQPAKANPSTFVRTTTAAASSTLAYMTAGTATTTLQISSTANVAFDSAVLNVCLTASSTATTLNVGREYSQDGQTWYADNLSERATTSAAINITAPWSFTYPYASTTPGGVAGLATANTGCKVVVVPTPEKYTRVFFTLPSGSTPGGIYAELVAKQQGN